MTNGSQRLLFIQRSLATIGFRLIGLVMAWLVIAAVSYIPWGYEAETWGRWEGFSFSQYFSVLGSYLSTVAGGSLGRTVTGNLVSQELLRVAPRSLVLLGLATTWAIVLGFVSGVIAIASRRRSARSSLLSSTFFALSIPDFFVVVLVQTVVLIGLRSMNIMLLPALGSMTVRGLILPVFTLGILPAAYVARLVTISLEEIEREDFLRTALAKGLSRVEALMFHGLRNVLATVINSLPSLFGMAVSSLIIVEYLYVYPGIGNMAINAFTRQRYYGPDSGVLAGAGLVLVTLYFILDAVAALARTAADPRLRGEVQ